MPIRKLALLSTGVAAAVAFMAMLSVIVILPWSEEVGVPDLSREQLVALSPKALSDGIRSGAVAVKTVSGAEKVAYLVTRSPLSFIHSWAFFFLPSVIAAFVCGLIAGGRRAP
jgi:hypothetical protein